MAEKEVQLVNNEEFTGRRERLNISDWSIVAVKGQTNRQKADIFDGFHSRFDFEITAHRHADYFIWKVILPRALIVAMSWSVFWIAPTSLDAQIALSLTSFLTLIAFIFATTNMVPKLAYFTRLDWFILGSTVFIFLHFWSRLQRNVSSSRTERI